MTEAGSGQRDPSSADSSEESSIRAPFGRYESSEAAEWPINEFLVGREPQRRRLLNLLFTHGKRGAYLVTGQRGCGKTSFVDYCVEEYQQDVFGRFLKSSVGQSWWDRAGLAVVLCLLGVVAFTLKGVLRFLVHEWQPAQNNNLGKILSVPLFLALLYPVVAALGLLRLVGHSAAGQGTVERQGSDQTAPTTPSAGPGSIRGLAAALVLLLGVIGWALGFLATVSDGWRGALGSLSHDPSPVVSFLFALTVILGHAGSLRPREVDQSRGVWPFFVRSGAIVLLLVLLVFGPLLGSAAWVGGLTGWPLCIAGLGAMFEMLGRRFGRPSRLSDWSGRAEPEPTPNDYGSEVRKTIGSVFDWAANAILGDGSNVIAPPNRRRFVRERTILIFKAVSLTVLSAVLLVGATLEPSPGESIYGELALSALLVALFISIARLEFNWIVRPNLRTLSGISLDLERAGDKNMESDNYARRLFNHTSFAFLYRWWLPTFIVRVNLGVEALDHRRVVEAMLAGLRDVYERTFLHWRSPLANAGRALRLLLLVTATTLVADHYFASNVPITFSCDPTCEPRPRINRLLCLAGGVGESITRGLQFPLIFRKDDPPSSQCTVPVSSERTSIAHFILPTSDTPVDSSADACSRIAVHRQRIDIRLYHLVIFLFLLLAARVAERKWPVFPYRRTLRDIDDAIASLSSTLTHERGLELKLGGETLTIGGKRGRETAPLDPRTVELLFLRLLRQIDEAALRLPFVAGARVSVPVPDLFFVFDELDKLGTRRPTAPPSPGSDEGPVIANDEERDRSLLLKSLFSDLKNILASAPSRFIFVGGRNLHDEWLADQTSRQPLLARLFVAEIYVPSLLTDRPKDTELSYGTDAFVRGQRLRADGRYVSWMLGRTSRWLRHRPREVLPSVFLTRERWMRAPNLQFHVVQPKTQAVAFVPGEVSVALYEDLLAFLTYRSMGNVKRLKELFEGFIQQAPEGSVRASNTEGQSYPEYTHALMLRRADVHRIQLIADLYRGVKRVFGPGIWQDDKLAPAVFYVADFLLKFHRRAFTWTNLERIDELIHVHRAPELRKVVHDIVEAWTGTLLHPIRNGMFDFRFRIETSLELRLASRRSDEEMASLNFTLDEAQDIKDLYRRRLASAADPAAFEFEAALGELHDLDEEYDLARYRYRRAIQRLDDQIANDLIGTHPTQSIDSREGSILRQILAGAPATIEIVRLHASWAISRLRLMLQIALTHERARDYESAALKYRSARALSESLLAFKLPVGTSFSVGTEPFELFKHANLLFQPAFAEAWVGEKEGGLIDASVALAERAIAGARERLPFVDRPLGSRPRATSPTDVQHSVFALTLAELHDKAGDLLFFKGKPSGGTSSQPRGYLDRSHIHYARSLHELREYNQYRRESSGPKLGFGTKPVLGDQAAPDFVLQIAAGSLADLGEALLAGTSLRATFAAEGLTCQRTGNDVLLGVVLEGRRNGAIPRMVDAILDWLEGGDAAAEFSLQWSRVFASSKGGDLGAWLGAISVDGSERARLEDLSFDPGDRGGGAQFIVSLLFSLAAARALKSDGRLEDASRESLQVAETVARWFLSYRSWEQLHRAARTVDSDDKTEPAEPGDAWRGVLGWIAVYAVERAKLWWELSRRSRPDESSGTERPPTLEVLGNRMPRAVGRLLVVLHAHFSDAASAEVAGVEGSHKAILDRLESLMEKVGIRPNASQIDLRTSLKQNQYPMTHQLYGRKILTDLGTIALARDPDGDRGIWWKDVEAMVQSDVEYDGRHRFTHSDIGLTLGAACLLAAKLTGLNERSAKAIPRVRTVAIEHLDRAEESFTLRRSYQTWIGDLYYLHDDFNDRRLHYNRAAEMAVSELISVMLLRLRDDARKADEGASSSNDAVPT